MNTTAPTRPAHLRSRRVQLAAGPAAVPLARRKVEAALRSWQVPADPDTAALLTSELVTNAIRHETGPVVTLLITCSRGRFRVEVHDTSPLLPEVTDAAADDETGRGLLLVATLAAEWGFYRTPAGKAVFFTLTFQPGQRPVNGRTVNGTADQRSTTSEVIT
jgi:anti-sigma regulatory factor (Ser/Thr protein kinase)